MAGKRKRAYFLEEIVEFMNHLMADRPLLPFLIPLILLCWAIERWIFPFSNWVPLAVCIWATIQYGAYQRKILSEDLNKKWKQVILKTSPITPLEHCEWLNKLLMEVWPNFINPKISKRFSSIVEKRLKRRKSRIIEKIELQDFSLGSSPPSLGLHGARWSTSGDQRILHMGFDWDTNDMSIMLFAKLAKPLLGTARIVINSIHIKGDIWSSLLLNQWSCTMINKQQFIFLQMQSFMKARSTSRWINRGSYSELTVTYSTRWACKTFMHQLEGECWRGEH